MRFPQVLVYEGDGRLAGLLRPLAEQRRWSLKEPRRPEGCLRLLARRGPAVLVVKLGRDLVREFELLDRRQWLYPDAAAVVVSGREGMTLAGLAWDLGAACVLSPGPAHQVIADVVARLMDAAVARGTQATAPPERP